MEIWRSEEDGEELPEKKRRDGEKGDRGERKEESCEI
jgi:hypothetical protein